MTLATKAGLLASNYDLTAPAICGRIEPTAAGTPAKVACQAHLRRWFIEGMRWGESCSTKGGAGRYQAQCVAVSAHRWAGRRTRHGRATTVVADCARSAHRSAVHRAGCLLPTRRQALGCGNGMGGS